MIDLEIIERGTIPAAWLNGLKSYASIPDDTQDAWLQICLNRAVLSVQEKADKSLIPCTFCVQEDDATGGIRLYQNVENIIGVRDAEGNGCSFSVAGRMVYVMTDKASVTYRTMPVQGNIDLLLPVVYQYATALYDGQDSRTLASILEQCR